MHSATISSRSERTGVGTRAATRINLEELTDEQLVHHCGCGSPGAFDALIGRYERSIFHLAWRLTGNHDDAQDVAAMAKMRIFRSISNFRCAITLPAWINRIVANVFYDMKRWRQRQDFTSLDSLIEGGRANALAAEENTWSSPAKYAEEMERSRILSEAISSLPDYQRRMVRLFHSDGRSYEEIADLMRIPVGTVKSRLSRARLALRSILAPQMSLLMNQESAMVIISGTSTHLSLR